MFLTFKGDFMALQDYIHEKPVLETERLILRALELSDIADLKEWLGDTSLYRYWGKRPGKTDLNPELIFQRREKPTKSFHWGIIHKADNKVIGEIWVYLIENNRMAKVAFRLSPRYQGNSFMTEALAQTVIFCFENTELRRLWSDVHILNTASYMTLEKTGFKREGHIREGKMVNIYCDYYLYGMTKADYIDITDKGAVWLRSRQNFHEGEARYIQ
jgi:ribosomal-protein-alanine N-acetyltransferase